MEWAEFTTITRPEVKQASERFIEAGINNKLNVIEFEAACEMAIRLVRIKRREEKVTV